jgi:hypothetical protein
MSILLVIALTVGGLGAMILRGLLAKEVQARIERYAARSVEATIASLPPVLQAEWADEWRAELAACAAMPLTAPLLALGLRRSARQLIGVETPGPARSPSRMGLLRVGRLRLARHPKLAAIRRVLAIAKANPEATWMGMTVSPGQSPWSPPTSRRSPRPTVWRKPRSPPSTIPSTGVSFSSLGAGSSS